jgi:hypothetical protein
MKICNYFFILVSLLVIGLLELDAVRIEINGTSPVRSSLFLGLFRAEPFPSGHNEIKVRFVSEIVLAKVLWMRSGETLPNTRIAKANQPFSRP